MEQSKTAMGLVWSSWCDVCTHTHTHTLYKIALLNPAMILNPYTPECIYVMR